MVLMPTLQGYLKNTRIRGAGNRVLRGDGYVRFAIDSHEWRGDGFNSAPATAGVVTVNFAAGANALPGSEALVNIALGDGDNVTIPLKNVTTANVAYATLLANAINGVSSITPGIQATNGTLQGFLATVATNTVTITGREGLKFTVTSALFGQTYNGVVNPAAPTITATVAPNCPGVLPYGVAVGIDPIANAAIGRRPMESSVLTRDPGRLLSLDTGSPTWSFVGITCKGEYGEFDYDPDCCDNISVVVAGYDCHDCAHYVEAKPWNPQQIAVTLEPPTAGDTVITQLIGTPVSRRVGAGTFSVGAPVGDTTRKIARNIATSSQFVVADVIDLATRRVFLQVAK
jgi:hypothetical protein